MLSSKEQILIRSSEMYDYAVWNIQSITRATHHPSQKLSTELTINKTISDKNQIISLAGLQPSVMSKLVNHLIPKIQSPSPRNPVSENPPKNKLARKKQGHNLSCPLLGSNPRKRMVSG